MGSVFARPPARAGLAQLQGSLIALDAAGTVPLSAAVVQPPVVLCLGADREGLPAEIVERAVVSARIPIREGGPESLNVAMAATVALYDLGNRMPGHA
jgi:TrmH family RNA methyltransferase